VAGEAVRQGQRLGVVELHDGRVLLQHGDLAGRGAGVLRRSLGSSLQVRDIFSGGAEHKFRKLLRNALATDLARAYRYAQAFGVCTLPKTSVSPVKVAVEVGRGRGFWGDSRERTSNVKWALKISN
jgi:hypothetical protein